MGTRIRLLERSDHDAVFAMMADPEAVTMAAFTAADPTDRAAFDAQMERILAITAARHWAVADDEGFVGTISTFPSEDGLPEVTYWIMRSHWGHGHASHALALVLQQTDRPVLARIAADNEGSRRVLEKAGFAITGRDRGYAAARGAEVDELLLRLD